jgi:exodeoxyribonuclease V gamma subunit
MLHIHRAERADSLVEALRALLADPLPDPFAPEVVAVPTRGMERWLTQRMSVRLGATGGRADGVCANVGFPSPRRLVGDALAAASGVAPDEDPWLPERAVWPLLEVIEGCLAEPWLGVLAAHLGDGTDEVRRARRFATVRHIAELYDRYAVQRPEMVRAGRRATGDGASDSAGAAWQSELWRRLRARIGVASPAERTAEATARLRDEPGLVDLPPRVALFGLTRLPPATSTSCARSRTHATSTSSSCTRRPRCGAASPTGVGERIVRRAEDPTATLPANRLLASWGQDARELQLVVAGDGAVDHHHAVEHATGTLLARIQAGVRDDEPPPGRPLPGEDDLRPLLDPADRSLQVHACHGRARQVEVLRDAILHLLEEDPTLEPRDVIVMCPDIETFAPLIHATFGAGELTDDEDGGLDALPDGVRPPDLRVRLADRSLRQTNPVLGVGRPAARPRRAAPDGLAGARPRRPRAGPPTLPPRRRRPRADGGLGRRGRHPLGLDAEHRRPFKLDALAAGTWRTGLDRVLVGVTMTEDDRRLFGDVLPLDDVESGAIDLAGRFAELVDRLRAACDALTGAKPIDAWAAALGDAAEALCATSQLDAWQRSELQRVLDDLVREATTDGALAPTRLALPEVRVLMAERLQGPPDPRELPHRPPDDLHAHADALGAAPGRVPAGPRRRGLPAQGVPRRRRPDPRRPARRRPRRAQRGPPAAARRAHGRRRPARRHLHGNDERTNAERPPAVPIGELLDVVDATVRVEGSDLARDRVVTRHPLQGFDPRNFVDGDLAPGGPWSFDRVTLDGARALTGERTPSPPFLDRPLPDARGTLVEVEDLVRFVERPVKAFLRQRLGISIGDYSDEVEDALPIELDGLEVWGVGQRLLDARLAGADLDVAVAAEIARGSLPPGRLADPVIAKVKPVVEQIAGHAEAVLGGTMLPGSVDVKVVLPDGRSLSGTVPGVCGSVLRTVTYSRSTRATGSRSGSAGWR